MSCLALAMDDGTIAPAWLAASTSPPLPPCPLLMSRRIPLLALYGAVVLRAGSASRFHRCAKPTPPTYAAAAASSVVAKLEIPAPDDATAGEDVAMRDAEHAAIETHVAEAVDAVPVGADRRRRSSISTKQVTHFHWWHSPAPPMTRNPRAFPLCVSYFLCTGCAAPAATRQEGGRLLGGRVYQRRGRCPAPEAARHERGRLLGGRSYQWRGRARATSRAVGPGVAWHAARHTTWDAATQRSEWRARERRRG